jgi:membrane-associated phospholipid phosphatase
VVAFVGFTTWRFALGAHGLDVTAKRFTSWLLHGTLDDVVSAMWPLGEPQLGVLVTAVIAGVLLQQRRARAAVLVVACFGLLTVIELGLRSAAGLADHTISLRRALVHAYPSGHTARVPMLGTIIAMLLGGRWRWPLLGLTALLTVMVSIDRVDSTLQLGSDVIGGVLLGSSLALAYVALSDRLR